MYQISRLANGCRIASAYLPSMSSICVGVWAGIGSRHESAHQGGISHFIEHMLFKGTTKRTAKAITESVESLGGYLNAFTSEENTCYYARASSRHFATLSDVLMDMAMNPTFLEEELTKEREVILEELAMIMDQPHQRVLEMLNEVCWPNHPLGRCITGTPKTLASMNAERLRRFWGKQYHASNLLVAVAGPLEHRQVVRQLSPLARKLPSGKPPHEKAVRSRQRHPELIHLRRSSEQVQLAIGIKTSSRHDSNHYALRVLNTILGENMSSRLFQSLREDHGLAYSIYSSLGFFNDAGLMVIAAGIEATYIPRSLKLIRQILEDLRQKPPSVKEIHQARDYLIGQLELHLENTENHMIWLGEHVLGFGHPPIQNQFQNRLQCVTPNAVWTAAQKTFQPQHMNLAAVGSIAKKQFSSFQHWMS